MSRLELVLPIKVQKIKLVDEPQQGGDIPAHEEGFNAGYQQGLLQAKWEMKRQSEAAKRDVQKMLAKLENIHAEFEKLVGEHLPELIHGALDRVFLKHRFSIEEVGEEIMALIHDMEHAGRLSLECAVEDQRHLTQLLSENQSIADPSKFSIHASANLKSGEFVLKSDLGNVDGRHAVRIRQITQALDVKI